MIPGGAPPAAVVSDAPRRITAVLACHGRAPVTRAGLTALFAQTPVAGYTIEASVVDDGSPDDTARMVESEFPQVRLLRGDGSLWWAGAMTWGLEEAAGAGPDFLLWLNDDAHLDRGAIGALLACHDATTGNGGEAIIVGATRDPVDGAVTYGGVRRDPRHPFRMSNPTVADTPLECDTFHGNVVLVPASVHRRLGGTDPAFIGVQGMADTDFGLRAGRAGVRVVQAPGTVAVCPRNSAPPAWRDPRLSPGRRLAALFGPKGFPPRGWFTFARRHGGRWWLFRAVAPYLRRLPAVLAPVPTAPDVPAKPRVALMDGLFPHYRLPVLEGLAARRDWDVVAFHGAGHANYSAVAVDTPLPLPTVRVRHRFWPGGRRIAWTGGVWTALTGKYDVAVAALHVHDLGVWALWAARRLTGAPRLVLSGHFRLTPEAPGLISRLRGKARRALARGADAVLPYTPRGATECAAHGIPPDKIHTTGNTIDVAAARAAAAKVRDEDTAALRDRLGISDGPVFLFVGRLYAAKRVDLAVDAITHLRRRGRNATLLIAGDGPERNTIAARTAQTPGVRLLGAIFDEARLASLFALSAAVVCPGAVGLVVVHAFAHGRPLVTCRDAPGHGVEIDYLDHGVNGLAVETMTPDGLAGALARLIDEPDTLAALCEGALRKADGMTIDTVVAANIAAYRRALAGVHRGT